jgi:hypothetical protein
VDAAFDALGRTGSDESYEVLTIVAEMIADHGGRHDGM